MASDLLELLTERDTTCITMKERVEDIKYRGINVRHDNLDFIFELKKSADDKYQLEMEDLQQAIFFEAYQLLFFDGTFFIPVKEVWESLKPLMEFHKVTKNEVVQFSESQLSEVISYVLPALQKSGKLKLDDSIEDRITRLNRLIANYLLPSNTGSTRCALNTIMAINYSIRLQHLKKKTKKS